MYEIVLLCWRKGYYLKVYLKNEWYYRWISISCDTNGLNTSIIDVISQAYFVAYFYHVFDG